ncbi:MAG: ABC transporter permease [Blastocatellia bacterium]
MPGSTMLKNYLKIAFRVLLRRKFFTFVSLFAISFTLVVLMVAASVLDHALGPHEPEPKFDRTLNVMFQRMEGSQGRSTSQGSGFGFLDKYARGLPRVEQVSIIEQFSFLDAYHNGGKIRVALKRTDGEFWRIYNFRFLEGGPISDEDDRRANFVAVINRATREKFFDDQPAAGKSIEVDGQRFRIIGVVENVPLLRFLPYADVWAPISTTRNDNYRRQIRGQYQAALVARDRADFAAIKSAYVARLAGFEAVDEFDNNTRFTSVVSEPETPFEFLSRMFHPDNNQNHPRVFLAILLSLAALFMVLPAVNLVNLNISRILERAGEIGVRKAFGASSWTLTLQFVIENVVLTLLGGVIGFALSLWVLRVIEQSGLIPYARFGFNYRIFLYGLSLALFFGLFSGAWPAWRMSRLHPVEALKGRA